MLPEEQKRIFAWRRVSFGGPVRGIKKCARNRVPDSYIELPTPVFSRLERILETFTAGAVEVTTLASEFVLCRYDAGALTNLDGLLAGSG
ncbi:MAG: hypothetical protein BWY80_00522 [Firmicutes bacterium ADurb.Bin456]|nr:MAG: hypothetical protein BWY80_00522 [Firmicutes bacterium ADurb.Bin456]